MRIVVLILISRTSRDARLRFWCAPMVAGSELAFRLQTRRHGAGVATAPMVLAGAYVHNGATRDKLRTCADDWPLIVQFAANDAGTLCEAARLAVERLPQLAAIELNLGCPQTCARRGHYGAFLMSDLPLVHALVHSLVHSCPVPVLAKTRIFESYDDTLALARTLVDAGARVLTVHARTREQKQSSWPTGALCGALSPIWATGALWWPTATCAATPTPSSVWRRPAPTPSCRRARCSPIRTSLTSTMRR